MSSTAFYYRILSLLVVMATFLPVLSHAQQVGETVIKRGIVDDDLYLAGAQVELYASVNGDVVVAGGQLNLEGDISADLVAAGGSIGLRGPVADDARLAGGDIRIAGRIGDDLVAAGGRIQISPVASIGGRAWISGGELRIDGHVVEELRASGGRVVISGKIDGNVDLWADQILIEDTAVIVGNLHYSSAHPANIASGARIDGEVVHTPVEAHLQQVIAGAIFALLLLLFSIIMTAVLLYLLFPEWSLRVSRSLRNQPWISLAVGLAVIAGAPVLMIILFSTSIGVWLGLMLLAVYLVLLPTGYFVGAMFVGNTGLDLLHRTEVSKTLRATALAIAILVLAVVNLVPLLGGLVNWLVLLTGTGAVSRQMYLAYRT